MDPGALLNGEQEEDALGDPARWQGDFKAPASLDDCLFRQYADYPSLEAEIIDAAEEPALQADKTYVWSNSELERIFVCLSHLNLT